jgi:hypothetical protein
MRRGERTKLVIEAHAVLYDPARRSAYNEQLRAERARAEMMAAFRAFQARAHPPTAVKPESSPEQELITKVVQLGLQWLFTSPPRRTKRPRARARVRYDPTVDRFRGPDGRFK